MSVQIPEDIQAAAIYVVEFDPATREQICAALSGLPWPVLSYETPRALLDALPHPARGCVVANVELANMTIVEFLAALDKARHRLTLILLSRDIEIPDAVAAMRAGVHDVLQLPVVERALRRQVRGAIEKIHAE